MGRKGNSRGEIHGFQKSKHLAAEFDLVLALLAGKPIHINWQQETFAKQFENIGTLLDHGGKNEDASV